MPEQVSGLPCARRLWTGMVERFGWNLSLAKGRPLCSQFLKGRNMETYYGDELSQRGKMIEILLVEDSPGDVGLTIEALKEAKINNRLHVVEDGVKAMEFLHKTGEFKDSPRPDLILLDLNLPRKNGREVLHEIKEDKSLRRIPVVILTTSRSDEDIFRAYDLHANCYISKPVDFEKFMDVVKSIEDFWLTVVKLPQNGIK
jgi:CheY-like chemotaxis protein